jgi:hypothetical protein
METKTWCAYNATRGCTLSSRVTVADSEREPLKVLKVMIEGLARDSKSSLWLTPLLHAPQLMRQFPYDLVYLDADHKVIQGAALLPGVQIPPFLNQTASALILPLDTLASSETQPGDQFVVCAAEELESRLAEVSAPATVAPVAPVVSSSVSFSGSSGSPNLPLPFPGPQIFNPTRTAPVPQGSGFTLALTTSWQITNSTVAAVLPDIAEGAGEATSAGEPSVAAVADAALPDVDAESAAVADGVEEAEELALVADAAVADAALPDADAEPAPTVNRVEENEGLSGATVADAAAPDVDAEPDAAVNSVEIKEPLATSEVSVEGAENASIPVEEAPSEIAPTAPAACESFAIVESSELGEVPAPKPDVETSSALPAEKIKVEEKASPNSMVRADAGRETPKKKSGTKKKGPFTTRLLRWLNLADPEEHRTYTRLVSPGLVAYDANDTEAKPLEVGDVSPTGLYLRTGERWRPGDLISLTLTKKSASEKEYHSRVAVQAGAVRCGEDGVGLSFVLPDDVEFRPWNRVHTKRATETDGEYFVRELRTANALGFLRRICPPASEEMRLLLYERHSNKRVANSVAIALKAEELIAQNGKAGSVVAHPDVVMRILEDGSWAEDEWIQQFWAGLLVTSCTMDGQDKSNLVFVDMLDKLTPIHLRILSAACRKGSEVVSAGESTSKLTLYFTADELIAAAGTHSLSRIHQTIRHLSNFGLLTESARPSYIAATEKKIKTKTTPTSLGLEMYARCNGRR